MSDFVIHLPSNVQPTRFPSNSASNYSTQLDKTIDLDGHWEVALAEVSYPKSVKMFQDEGITFTRTTHTAACASDGQIVRKRIQVKGSIKQICATVNKISPLVFTVKYDEEKGFELEVHSRFHLVHITQSLQDLMGFPIRDFVKGITRGKKIEKTPIVGKRGMIKVVDLNCLKYEDVIIKTDGTLVSSLRLLSAILKEKLEKTGIRIELLGNRARLIKETSVKTDDSAIFLNYYLRMALGFTSLKVVSHRGTYIADRDVNIEEKEDMKEVWSLRIYRKKLTHDAVVRNTSHWKVPSPRTNTIESLVFALNENRIHYPYKFHSESGRLSLTLHDENVEMSFDKKLAEKLGFHRTYFTGKKTYHASWEPEFYRNIDYVFIYSNICDYVNVGHMTAPLLHAVPFISDGHGPLVHHAIRYPIYRPMKTGKLDRIELRLCDGNGQDIPFADGKTLIVLNLRRRIL